MIFHDTVILPLLIPLFHIHISSFLSPKQKYTHLEHCWGEFPMLTHHSFDSGNFFLNGLVMLLLLCSIYTQWCQCCRARAVFRGNFLDELHSSCTARVKWLFLFTIYVLESSAATGPETGHSHKGLAANLWCLSPCHTWCKLGPAESIVGYTDV